MEAYTSQKHRILFEESIMLGRAISAPDEASKVRTLD
jgi:hypothetical protein